MERPSYEIVFSITLLKSREHKLILIFQEIANKQKNPITIFMLQEILVPQKINDHS